MIEFLSKWGGVFAAGSLVLLGLGVQSYWQYKSPCVAIILWSLAAFSAVLGAVFFFRGIKLAKEQDDKRKQREKYDESTREKPTVLTKLE